MCCAFYLANNSEQTVIACTLVEFHSDSDGKESACNAGDLGSIPGSGRSPGEGNGYLCQYSSLENSMDRGTWWTTVHGVTKSWTWVELIIEWKSRHWKKSHKYIIVLSCLMFSLSLVSVTCGQLWSKNIKLNSRNNLEVVNILPFWVLWLGLESLYSVLSWMWIIPLSNATCLWVA